MKKAWEFLNGNKTIICMTTATVLQQAVQYGLINESNGVNFAIGLSITLGTGSLGHHLKKGYFTRKKGH